jgi:hypothetical protein
MNCIEGRDGFRKIRTFLHTYRGRGSFEEL